jgi:hypothetical protein
MGSPFGSVTVPEMLEASEAAFNAQRIIITGKKLFIHLSPFINSDGFESLFWPSGFTETASLWGQLPF